MFVYWVSAVFLGLTVVVALVVLIIRYRERRCEARLAHARQIFHRRREWLEARFLTLAGRTGKPRGLSWADCDFDNHVEFARDRSTGQLRALVAVTIRFEAIAGGGMEDVEAVGNLRAATAVFRYDGEKWETDGRALFNVSPRQAIQRYQNELETVD